MAKYARHPDDLLLMPGMAIVVGRTEAEAREQHEFLQASIHPDVGRALLAAALGNTDIGDADLDKPLPLDRIPVIDQGARTTVQNLRDVVVRENPTVRRGRVSNRSGTPAGGSRTRYS
jgi:N-acetyl-S-(2-succino)cysteine monooxygenase